MNNRMISYRAVLLAVAVTAAVGCGSQAEIGASRGPQVATLSRGCGSAVVASQVQPVERPRPPAVGMCR
jgi:hypothetical protein